MIVFHVAIGYRLFAGAMWLMHSTAKKNEKDVVASSE
jgi:hypothetical protein